MKAYTFKIVILLLFFLCVPALAQNKNDNSKEIEKIKKEISLFENKLKKEGDKEKDLIKEKNRLGEEIALRRKLVNSLKRSERRIERNIKESEKEIEKHKQNLKILRKSAKSRLISLYKYGRERELKALILSKSVTRAYTGLKYFLIIAKEDNKKINAIREENENLERSLAKNRILLTEKQKVAKEKGREIGKINNSIKSKESTLRKVRTNKEYYARLLREKEDALREYGKLFENNNNGISPLIYDVKFSTLRDQLPWPVEGRVVSRQGLYRDPKLKTTTLNPGIEIKTAYGTKVRAVARGRVKQIRWMPYFGQLVIIKHGENYHTGYAYLSEIHVELEQEVYPGDIIANVGRDQLKNESKLLFMVNRGMDSLNPEVWLR